MLKQVSHSKILIQSKGNLSYSFVFIVIFYFFEFREFLFIDMLNAGCAGFLRRFREGRGSGYYMSAFSASEAKSSLSTAFLFFGGQLGDFDCINIHSIVVFYFQGGGKGLEGLGGPFTLLSDLVSLIPLVLELSSFGVPLINFCRDSVKGYDSFHQHGGDSDSKETNEDIGVHYANTDNVALEG